MAMSEERTVLCGANAYDKKYYYNEAFAQIPKSIQDEPHIICVLFTEEIGGIFTIVFERDGEFLWKRMLRKRISVMMRSAVGRL